MKASAANLRAEAMAESYQKLEVCGRENRIADAQSLFHQTRQEHGRAVLQLRQLLSEAA